jgi:hypothetical protein
MLINLMVIKSLLYGDSMVIESLLYDDSNPYYMAI